MSLDYRSIVLGPGEGKAVSTLGVELCYKAVGEETGGVTSG